MLTDDPKHLRGSTVCGELAGHAGVTKWSPEQHRRQALVAVGFGHRRSGSYSVQTRKQRGWFEGEAHNGFSGADGELEGGPERTGRQSGSPATAVGEELSEGSAEHASAQGGVFWMK